MSNHESNLFQRSAVILTIAATGIGFVYLVQKTQEQRDLSTLQEHYTQMKCAYPQQLFLQSNQFLSLRDHDIHVDDPYAITLCHDGRTLIVSSQKHILEWNASPQ